MKIPNIADIVDSNLALTSPPQVITEINQALADRDVSVKQVVEIIAKDPALTAALLRLINSPYYRLPNPITSIGRAVTVLGFQGTRDLVTACAIMESFKNATTHYININHYWSHSFSCAAFTKTLANKLDLDADGLFTAGLLHDIGVLVLYTQLNPEVSERVKTTLLSGANLPEAEQEILGFDHAMVGAQLLHNWDFPQLLIDAAGCHHQPELARDDLNAVCLIHIADFLASMVDETAYPERPISKVNPMHCQALNIEPEALDAIMTDLAPNIPERALELVFE